MNTRNIRSYIPVLALAFLVLLLACGQTTPGSAPKVKTVTPATAEAQAPSEQTTNTSEPTPVPKLRDTPTPIPTITPTVTPKPTDTPTPIPTITPTVTLTPLPTNTSTVTPTPSPTETPTVTPTPLPPTKTPRPTPTRTTQDLVQESADVVAKEQFRDDLMGVKAAKVAGRIVVTVDYNLSFSFDEVDAVRASAWNLRAFAPSIFGDNRIDTLELRMFTDFKDQYGNIQKEVAMKYTITQNLATKVNWSQVDPRQIGRLLQSENKGNGVYVHPTLKAAWVKYQQR